MEKQSLSSRNKDINLIPSEMAVPARAVKFAKVISKVSIISSIVLLLVILGLGSYYIYLSLEDKKITQSVNGLKNRISALSQNEQKLILAKDRLSKITSVKKAKSANNEVTNYQKFINQISGSGEFQITEANLTTKGTEITLVSQNSSNLTGILKALDEIKGYQRVIISSLAYNQGSGFVANFLFELQ